MMKKKFTIKILSIVLIPIAYYLIFVFLKYYNSPENIEQRCILKFQKYIEKGTGKSEEEWGLNMDIATNNYFKCMKIP